ncbi:hypothetical protein GCM10009854_36050 [Saccharopolyspora halophila]|uniref:N-acetyltransferase domain-containing protein n=1 Tax=Saccharopolyspora halophila TaxID=405551 RepID=A0ABP5TLF4_9PSEU
MADLRTRTLTDAESDEFLAVFGAAFLRDLAVFRPLFEHIRPIGAFDGAELIGVAGHFDQTTTVPGGLGCPLAAVTTVGVKPDHRRRGAANALMRHQLDDQRAAGVPLAALHASEGAIYGRYGYGVASASNHLEVPGRAAFRPGVEVDERPVREVTREQALPALHEQYARIAAHRTGWLARDAGWEARTDPGTARRRGRAPVRAAPGGPPDLPGAAQVERPRPGLPAGDRDAGRRDSAGLRRAVAVPAGPRPGRRGGVAQGRGR